MPRDPSQPLSAVASARISQTGVPAAPSTTGAGAGAAANADALARRVADLEHTLATERTRNASRIRDVDSAMRSLRDTVTGLQEERRRAVLERDQLRAQLERMHRELAAPAPAPAVQRTEVEDRALLDARRERDQLRTRLAEAARETAALREKLAVRDADLRKAAEALAFLERRCDEADRARAAPGAGGSVADRDADRDESATGLSVEEEALQYDRSGAATQDGPSASTDSDMIEDTGTAPGPVASGDAHPAALPESARRLDAVAEQASTPSEHERERERDARAAQAADPQDPSFPEIAGLRLERLVSDGPQGRVFEAREVPSRRPVTVHMLSCALRMLDGKRLDSLLLAKHANLVSALNFAVTRDGPYLVVERTSGENAEAWVRRVGPLPERVALAVALECARGLRQAAFHGAHHGELSPAHVWIDASGGVRVSGAGQRPILAPADETASAPSFASPERLRGSPPPDSRSDVYSLGCVVWFLLTGKSPFVGDKDAIQRHQAAGAPSVRESRPEVSAETAKLLQRMMATDPDERHMTWDQLLVDLERRVPGRVSEDLRGNFSARVRRFAIAHPWVVPAAILALLGLAVVAHLGLASDVGAAGRFASASGHAEALAARGDKVGAREIYRRWLSGTGDPSVERQAARRFDQLGEELLRSR